MMPNRYIYLAVVATVRSDLIWVMGGLAYVFPPIQRELLASQLPLSAHLGYNLGASSGCCEGVAAGLRGFLAVSAALLGLSAGGEGEGAW